MALMYMVRFALVLAVLLVNCVLIQVLQWPFWILKPVLPRWLFRSVSAFTQRAFTEILLLLCWLFAPNELVVTGDELPVEPESVILMSNHQTYADWIYLWLFAYFYQAHGMMKIILKASLKHVPLIGWGMRVFEFIFLNRRWEVDQVKLAKCLDRIANDREPLWLLIFPEGTVITESTRSKSLEYAKRVGITDIPKHVLLPRSTGIKFCIQHLHKDITALYDVTLGYSGTKSIDVPQEVFTLRRIFVEGRPPEQVHIHVKRLPIEPIVPLLTEDETPPPNRRSKTPNLATDSRSGTPSHYKFSQFIQDRFMKKDVLMDNFYQTGAHEKEGGVRHVVPLGSRWHVRNIANAAEFALPKVWLAWFLICIGYYAS